jgi:hypothetical protein
MDSTEAIMSTSTDHGTDPWAPRGKAIFALFAAIGAYFQIVEHGAHIIPYLPWVLLAACPLVHIFMHGGHGGYGDRRHSGIDGGDASADRDVGTRMGTGAGERHAHSHDGGQT